MLRDAPSPAASSNPAFNPIPINSVTEELARINANVWGYCADDEPDQLVQFAVSLADKIHRTGDDPMVDARNFSMGLFDQCACACVKRKESGHGCFVPFKAPHPTDWRCMYDQSSPVGLPYPCPPIWLTRFLGRSTNLPCSSPAPTPLRPICAGGIGSATCLNGALLLISRTDRILYIERGAGLNDLLTDKRIHDVSHRFLMERGPFVFVTIHERRR